MITELPERFWSKTKNSDTSDCIEWTAYKNRKGYGLFWFVDKVYIASRLALMAKLGRELLPDMQTIHSCDNPPCVNQNHLSEGSAKDNSEDKWNKGRAADVKGIKNGRAILSPEKVMLILVAEGTQVEIGKRFGVSRQTVSCIQNGLLWKSLTQKGIE